MKYSKQREMILNYIIENKNHPTAEQIYTDLKPDAPALSLATVYRNLNLLCQIGEIQKLDTGETVDRFDADTSNHAHFICENCHSVTDIFIDAVNQKMIIGELGNGFSIDRHKLFLYGKCSCCSQVKQ
ncbi:MAG: transcriptional repressor [Clostridia bacterium]|nr:transcriptional repressor [Clostridia bacterium]